MKHDFEIKPRGKKTKYYICRRCGLKLVGTSKSEILDYERKFLEKCRKDKLNEVGEEK